MRRGKRLDRKGRGSAARLQTSDNSGEDKGSVIFEHEFVDVAPHPGFTGLLCADDGMLRSVKMLGGVFVLRGVAAADVAASQTQAQMHPTVAHLEALFAALGFRLDALDLIDVRASIGHCGCPFISCTRVIHMRRITLRLESECESESAYRRARK